MLADIPKVRNGNNVRYLELGFIESVLRDSTLYCLPANPLS